MKKRIVVAVVLAVLLATSGYAQTTNFFELVMNGTPEDVQAAIDKGADVNAPNTVGETPLIVAAGYNKNPKVITTLLKAGADINAQDSLYGSTALIWAAYAPNLEAITTLLQAGADAKAKSNEGKTAFDYAKDNYYLKGTDALKKLEEASR